MSRRRRIGEASLQLAEDYAEALRQLEARSETATVEALRRSLAGVMAELKRAYGRYLEAAAPEGVDAQGRPLQRSGAAVIRESSARLRSILEISQDFLSEAEILRWQQQLERDLTEAQRLGGELSRELAQLSAPEAALPFGGANGPAVAAAVRNAGAYLGAEGARFREQLVAVTADAAARGWGPKRMEAQVRRALEGAGDPTGKTRALGLRQRAALIARSELATAYAQGQLEHTRRQGFEYVRWVAVKDERACPYCASRHGQIYPAGKVVTPAHPRCRCVTTPVPQEVADLPAGEARDGLLDQAFWRESQQQAWKEYAEAKGMEPAAARKELQRYLKLPTASEKRRYPGVLESLMPSVALET
jgi:SPP1 gp7 family putative phage head morphogenesis protein